MLALSRRGYNSYGNLGTGTLAGSPGVAKRVAPKITYNFTQISAGNQHTCGVLNTQFIFCWGRNSHGQMAGNLTIGNAYYYSLPRPGWPKHTFTKVVCGNANTYAIE